MSLITNKLWKASGKKHIQ